MSLDRTLPFASEQPLYHYCSVETFLKIVQGRKLRFSDARCLNDAEEAYYATGVFAEAIERVRRRDGLPANFPEIAEADLIRFENILQQGFTLFRNFVCCFSEDGDLLNQWRAYADNARGLSIGFKASTIRTKQIDVYRVSYDRLEQQRELLDDFCFALAHVSRSPPGTRGGVFSWHTMRAVRSSFGFKNKHWQDERELRCSWFIQMMPNQAGAMANTDDFTTKDTMNLPIDYLAQGGRIVPYIDVPYLVDELHQPLTGVVLGPRCQCDEAVVREVLESNGFTGVPITRSGAAYR